MLTETLAEGTRNEHDIQSCRDRGEHRLLRRILVGEPMQPAIALIASSLLIKGFAKRIAKVKAKLASRVEDPAGSLFGQVRRVLLRQVFGRRNRDTGRKTADCDSDAEEAKTTPG